MVYSYTLITCVWKIVQNLLDYSQSIIPLQNVGICNFHKKRVKFDNNLQMVLQW